jgi:hypothetical protein
LRPLARPAITHTLEAALRSSPARSAILLLALAAPLALGGCSSDHESAGATDADGRAASVRRLPPYRERSVANGGRLEGTVELREAAPADTVVAPQGELALLCGGTALRVPLVEAQGRRLGETVVWLEDVREGKPLPRSRRFSLESERCRFRPRVQGAIAGGILNLMSADAIVHRTSLVRNGAVVETVEHPDAGSVVPLESVLAAPGLVEARSETIPWLRAWIHVFDHPYFAVTQRDGRWSLDSIPPGTHRLVFWHPRFGARDTTVSVEGGRSVSVVVGYGRARGER